MRELDKYNVLKEKLQGVCDENNLTYSIQNMSYPFRMIIKPLGGVDAQQTMLEGMDTGETGYISPDATLVFATLDGDLSYKISESWTISAKLFDKLKNLFKKMDFMWTHHFHRDVIECGAPTIKAPAPVQDEDTTDAFADFMDTAAPAVDDEE